MKNVYEILDEFEVATTHEGRVNVIQRNLSKTLVDIFMLTFHPEYEWTIKELPHTYVQKPIPKGLAYTNINMAMRKFKIFRKGNPEYANLKEHKKIEILLEMLEALEPREAEVVMGIFRKDLGVKGLDYKFVKKCFPDLLP